MMILFFSSFFMIMVYSFNFNNNKIHPLILMSILLILLVISSLNLSMFLNNHWFSFLMFIIIVGGMMIIFLYFISFINNMKTSIKWNFLKFLPVKISLMIMMFYLMFNYMNFYMWILNFNEIMPFYKSMNLNILNLNYMYIYPKNLTTLLSMIYLLISLTIIVKICLLKKLTLRKINYEKIYF